MTNEELAGRICAVEVLAMMAMGMHLANLRNDPDYQKPVRRSPAGPSRGVRLRRYPNATMRVCVELHAG